MFPAKPSTIICMIIMLCLLYYRVLCRIVTVAEGSPLVSGTAGSNTDTFNQVLTE